MKSAVKIAEFGPSDGLTPLQMQKLNHNFTNLSVAVAELDNSSKGLATGQDGTLAEVAYSGSYSDLDNKPDLSQYAKTADLAAVATSGDYDDLTDKPDLSVYAESSDLADVATSGDYNDLINTPTIPPSLTVDSALSTTSENPVQNKVITDALDDKADSSSLSAVATSGAYSDLSGKPSLAAVATSGDYGDLSNKPDLSVYAESANLATVATSGAYSDLSGTPSLASVATSGDYDDLVDKPIVPKVFYGTSSSAATDQDKVVTATGFTASDLVAGTVLIVLFSNANTYDGVNTINVNNTGTVAVGASGTANYRYYWKAGEMVAFVHTGTYWIMLDQGTATTTYYGMTKLSSSTSSTSTSVAATPSAVKAAYDLAAAAAPASSLATVATTGDYNDLINKPPTITVSQDSITGELSIV